MKRFLLLVVAVAALSALPPAQAEIPLQAEAVPAWVDGDPEHPTGSYTPGDHVSRGGDDADLPQDSPPRPAPLVQTLLENLRGTIWRLLWTGP